MVELPDWKTISTDLHRGPPSIEVMKFMRNFMLISNFSSRVPTKKERSRLLR